MIQLQRSTDMPTIRAIANDSRIYDQMAEDGSPKCGEYEPPVDGAIYVLVWHEGTPRGMFALVPKSAIRFEVHTLLLPELSPWRKLEAAARMSLWVWANTSCRSLFTEVPLVNSAALGFAKAAGMVEFGREPKAFLKNGELHDIMWLGMNRPEEN